MRNFLILILLAGFSFSTVFAQKPLWFTEYDASAFSKMETSFSPDSRYFVSGSDNGEVIIRETATGEIYNSYKIHQKKIFCCVFRPKGNLVASSDKKGKLVFYDYKKKEVLITIDAHKEAITSMCFSPDGDKLVTGGKDDFVKTWSVPSGKLISEIDLGKTICSLRFTPDGDKIVVGTTAMQNGIRILDSNAKNLISKMDATFASYIDLDPNGKYIAVASAEKDVQIWDLSKGVLAYRLLGNNRVEFSPGVYMDVSGVPDNKLSFCGHTENVNSVAYSPTQNMLISGSADKSVIFWNLDNKKKIASFNTPSDFENIVISPNGYFFAMLSQNGKLSMWSVNMFVNADSVSSIVKTIRAAKNIKSHITDVDVKYLKAERLCLSGKYSEAKKLIEEYIESSNGKIDEHFSPYMYLGICYYIEKNYDKSMEFFKKDIESDATRCLYKIAALYSLKGDTANAILWLIKDQSSNGATPKSEILKDSYWTSYLTNSAFKKAINTRPPLFKVFVDSCDYYVSNKNIDMAIKMIDEAIKIEPENIKGYHGKGSLYMMKKEYKNALSAFQKEIDIESGSSYKKVKTYSGQQQFGQALSFLEDFEESINNTNIAIHGNKTMYVGYLDLATFQMRQNQFEDAKFSITDYLRIADDDEIGHYMAGLVYLNLREFEKSKHHAQKAIDLNIASGGKVPKEYYNLLGK